MTLFAMRHATRSEVGLEPGNVATSMHWIRDKTRMTDLARSNSITLPYVTVFRVCKEIWTLKMMWVRSSASS